MYPRLSLTVAALLVSACPVTALSQSDPTATYFTLQVASFPAPELANTFAARLASVGEHAVCSTVDLQDRGHWTRVLVGLFATTMAARRYGRALVARGIIKEFLIRSGDFDQDVTRPRTVKPADRFIPGSPGEDTPSSNPRLKALALEQSSTLRKVVIESASARLPVVEAAYLTLAPSIDTTRVPRPDPVVLAVRFVLGYEGSAPQAAQSQSGLWLTDDTAEGMSRLRWVVGEENARLVKVDERGRVQLDKGLLAEAAGLGAARVEDPLRVANYISSNEGLLLLVQLTEGRHRYLLNIGRQAPTRGREVEISGSINLDNNFDSRINPYRKQGRKLDEELPPKGFDSVVGINPVAQWFNLSAHCWVAAGEITFHELAEALAKVELGRDYLDQGSRAGAHALALEREQRLKSQRPGADIVLTAGANRLLRTQREIRLFYAETAAGVSQR